MTVFVIAMEKEAAPVIAHMNVKSEETVCNKRIFRGQLFGTGCNIVRKPVVRTAWLPPGARLL